ncbi:DNA mismatch repair protein Msh1 [Eremomyces bilateralis CBS 781.70]|uniref:DNA mismatch repair protein Msh1 n=1 Tax=Eremomyces bilateralis CBS 781.70 TaxID=1392243 RepID=A0A6G1G7G6_9PEZI|nr:DNA mismatch repair protein Msh1 [Eremomyces bilateralis CBS 781.70]KAF1813993.1 DNA mismatch repair protein Msh1 [Eremomyces bilateralis CBS 781.70]
MRAILMRTGWAHRKAVLSGRSLCAAVGLHRACIKPSLAPKPHSRSKRTSTRVKISELPQGPLPALAQDAQPEDEPAYPTVVQQARNNMRKFNHCVVLTRVGSFYELYFEQAEEFGPLLNLKLAQKKTSAGPVYMSGFPFFQLDRYLKILVQDLNKYVAISEEFANDPAEKAKSGGLLFDRKVTRIITPGTLIDEKFMDPWENNFLMCIQPHGSLETPSTGLADVGIAWLDLSSGDFFTQKATFDTLSSIVARIGPREILLDSSLRDAQHPQLAVSLNEGQHVVSYHDTPKETPPLSRWPSMVDEPTKDWNAAKFSDAELSAGYFLVSYVEQQLFGAAPKLQPPMQRQAKEAMLIDKNTLRALEIQKTLKDGAYEGSLLQSVRRTVTKSGARLLRQRLSMLHPDFIPMIVTDLVVSPSMSLEEINNRLDMVGEMYENEGLCEHLILLLRRTFDSFRLVQKFAFGKGDADDLLGLSETIQVTKQIADLLQEHITRRDEGEPNSRHSVVSGSIKYHIQDLVRHIQLDGPLQISNRITKSIDEDMLSQQHLIEDSEAADMLGLAEEVLTQSGETGKLKGTPQTLKRKEVEVARANRDQQTAVSGNEEVWIMRRTASPTLNRLHSELDTLHLKKTDLETELRERASSSTLTLKWTPGLGHICHVKGKDARTASSTLSGARSVSSSKSTHSFHLPEWTALGTRLDEATARIRSEESRIFAQLRTQVVKNLVKLRRNAGVLDEVDVACGFATLARERSLTRPVVNRGTAHHILGGRHPTVEVGLMEQGRRFTANDCVVGDKEEVLLITGPNMAGKSTYLRQNALISILAQTGSFVSADYAEIGLVDKIFSRVGSADNLYQDQSTFMVEMLETAEILKQATSRSFVIMDEVGRGTTPEDGIAVAFACLHHLHYTNNCRALFATHFHSLAEMSRHFERLGCYCTDIAEDEEGGFTFIHKVRRGVNTSSHALKVARLAGLPDKAIQVAEHVLENIKARSSPEVIDNRRSAQNSPS